MYWLVMLLCFAVPSINIVDSLSIALTCEAFKTLVLLPGAIFAYSTVMQPRIPFDKCFAGMTKLCNTILELEWIEQTILYLRLSRHTLAFMATP